MFSVFSFCHISCVSVFHATFLWRVSSDGVFDAALYTILDLVICRIILLFLLLGYMVIFYEYLNCDQLWWIIHQLQASLLTYISCKAFSTCLSDSEKALYSLSWLAQVREFIHLYSFIGLTFRFQRHYACLERCQFNVRSVQFHLKIVQTFYRLL